jgi:hypothetical protein
MHEIEAVDDRAAGILAAAFVEDYLAECIKLRVQEDAKLFEELFREDGLFGSFGAKIRMGFLIGIYDAALRKELNMIAKIRNRFAHRRSAKDFKSEDIRDLVMNLKAVRSAGLEFKVDSGSGETPVGIEFLGANPSDRQVYVATCVMFLFYFGLRPPMVRPTPAFTARTLRKSGSLHVSSHGKS